MNNIIILAALIAVAVLLIWSAFRAWRIERRILKWSGVTLAALLAIVVSSLSAVAIAGMLKQHSRHAPIPDIKAELTPERVARGKEIAGSFCDSCHTRTAPLTGGLEIGEHFPIPIGSFITANLTPAGSLKGWSDGEIFRAIRNAVGADGRWLTVMSYTNTGRMSDDDTLAVIAYLRSMPAAGVPTREPPDRMNLLGVVLLGAGMLPSGKPVSTGHISGPPKSANAQFGEYILSYQDCRECHGANLSGGVQGQLAPVGPGLSLVKEWTLAEFISTMRTGIDPTGHQLGKEMPWKPVGRMDDEELTAVYQYLTHLPDS